MIKMLIAQQIIVTATFPLHHSHQRLILHKICYIQPVVKKKLSKKFSWGHPFSKMPKMSHFSGLGNGRLRYVRSKVSGAEPLTLKCLLWLSFQVTFNDVTVAVGRSGIPIVAVKSTFSSPFWRPNLGDKKAHSSTTNSHNNFSIAPSSSAPRFT